MSNLREFIDKLEAIYKEAASSGHTRGKYPPEITFYIDSPEYDLVEMKEFELDTSNAVCCSDIIGATVIFRLHERV